MATWYLGGFMLLGAGAIMQVGPYAWVAAWQARHWGWNSVLLSFLPGFVLLALPVTILQFIPRRPDWPFLSGAQDAFGKSLDPARRPSPERMAAILRRFVIGGLIMSAVFPVAGLASYGLIEHLGNRGAGVPLPERTLAAVSAPGAALPDYARLVGAEPRPEIGWVHDEFDRRLHRRDFYMPLTPPGWHAGDPVAVLEVNRTVVRDDPPDPSPPAPFEGTLERGVPDWIVSELRQNGAQVTNDPILLVRHDLHGVVPGADMIGASLGLVFGATFMLASLGASLAWHIRRQRLLRGLAGQP